MPPLPSAPTAGPCRCPSCTSWLRSRLVVYTYRPHTNHKPTTNQPQTNHIPTTYRPQTNHIPTTNQPHTDHKPTTYRPQANHVPTTCRLIPMTYRPHTNQILYQPHTDHIPTHTDHIATTYRPPLPTTYRPDQLVHYDLHFDHFRVRIWWPGSRGWFLPTTSPSLPTTYRPPLPTTYRPPLPTAYRPDQRVHYYPPFWPFPSPDLVARQSRLVAQEVWVVIPGGKAFHQRGKLSFRQLSPTSCDSWPTILVKSMWYTLKICYVFIIAPCSMMKAALFPKLGPPPSPHTTCFKGDTLSALTQHCMWEW